MRPETKAEMLDGLWFLLAATITLVVVHLTGCKDDGCTAGEIRCDGDVLQVCDGSSYWEDFDDCKKEYGEKCCQIDVADYDCLEECK